jgi:hypothetical protein
VGADRGRLRANCQPAVRRVLAVMGRLTVLTDEV